MKALAHTNERGMALLSVLVIALLLIVLGLSLLTLSAANTRQAVAVDTAEQHYRQARSAAAQAMELLKSVTLARYAQMRTALQSGDHARYAQLYGAFFEDILRQTRVGFAALDNSAWPGISLSVSATQGTHTRTFTVAATSAQPHRAQQSAMVDIARIDIQPRGGAGYAPAPGQALVSGQSVALNPGSDTRIVINGDALAPAYKGAPGQFATGRQGGQYMLSDTRAALPAWDLSFADFTVPAQIPPGAALHAHASGQNADITLPPDASRALYVLGDPGTALQLAASGAQSGVIRTGGDLSVSLRACANLTISAQGDLTLRTGTALSDSVLYCTGNFTLEDGVTLQRCQIYAGGDAYLLRSPQAHIGGVLYCAGDLHLGSLQLDQAVLVAGANINLGGDEPCNLDLPGLLYAKGVLRLQARQGAVRVNGQIAAQGGLRQGVDPGSGQSFTLTADALLANPLPAMYAEGSWFRQTLLLAACGQTQPIRLPQNAAVFTNEHYGQP